MPSTKPSLISKPQLREWLRRQISTWIEVPQRIYQLVEKSIGNRDLGRSRRRPRWCFEHLEDRALLAGFTVNGSTLALNLTAVNESVAITSAGSTYAFVLTGGTWSGTDGGL